MEHARGGYRKQTKQQEVYEGQNRGPGRASQAAPRATQTMRHSAGGPAVRVAACVGGKCLKVVTCGGELPIKGSPLRESHLGSWSPVGGGEILVSLALGQGSGSQGRQSPGASPSSLHSGFAEGI